MDNNIKLTQLQSKQNFTLITYKGKNMGLVEYRNIYGNNRYYAHIDNHACEYNSFEDAVAHLFWRNGFTIAESHKKVGIK